MKAKMMEKVTGTKHEAMANQVPVSSAERDAGGGPPEHELDMHHDTLMKAESIKGNDAIMKYLEPHMAKKFEHMKKLVPEKVTSIKGLRDKISKKLEEN